MRKIHKYPISLGKTETITVPYESKVVHVAIQNACTCLWIMVDTAYRNTERHFKVLSTGEPIPFRSVYIGTVQEFSFVGHIFEVQTNANNT